MRPILVANCIRCHNANPAADAPQTFRLDVLDDVDGVKGARSMAEFIAARAASLGDMPPRRAGLSARQKQILTAWQFTTAAGKRPANLAPEVSMTSAYASGANAMIDLLITDGDGDLVSGELKLDAAVVGPIRSGAQTIAVDTSGLLAGARALSAILDDGETKLSVELGTIEVTHDNAVPRLAFTSVKRDDLIVAGQPLALTLRTDDADGDPLTVDIDAVLGDERVRVAGGVTPELSGLVEIEVATGDLAAGDGWRFEATVADGKSSRTVTSAPFIVSVATTAETHGGLRQLIKDNCGACHSPHLPTGPNFSTLAQLQAFRGRAWRKVLTGEMPPPSARVVYPQLPPLSDADRERLVGWFYAGAPE